MLDRHGVDAWFAMIAARDPGIDVGWEWINRPWDLISRNGAYIERDFQETRRTSVTNCSPKTGPAEMGVSR
jgi:hypothetical protein